MSEKIREIIISTGIYDCICDPYDQLSNGDAHGSTMIDLERLANLVLDECCLKLLDMDEKTDGNHNYYKHAALEIKRHFGVDQ